MISVLRINGFHIGAWREKMYQGFTRVAPTRSVFDWDHADKRWSGIVFDLGWWRIFVGRRLP